MAKSNRRIIVKLVSSAGTGVFKTIQKLKGSAKIEKMCYDHKVRKHVLFKEVKGGLT